LSAGIASRASQALAHRFAVLIGRVQPLQTAIDRAGQRATLIERRLETAFNVRRFLRVGSLWKRTAIRDYSDLDLFVVVSRDDVRWGDGYVTSTTLLGRVRDELRNRFPATSGIRRDGQAVSVVFSGGGPGVDVVPAFFDAPAEGGHPVYLIPDGAGGWLRTCPDAQKRYLDDEDTRCGGKLRRVVQLLKWWAQARAHRIPLLSHHLEMVMASLGPARVVASYSTIVDAAFEVLLRRGGAAFNDPLGLSGRIPAVRTEAQHEEMVRATEYAAYHARAAVAAEDRGHVPEAIRQWRIVFEGFPP
jgi:hypothetical protein